MGAVAENFYPEWEKVDSATLQKFDVHTTDIQFVTLMDIFTSKVDQKACIVLTDGHRE